MLERFRLEHKIAEREHEQIVADLGWTMKEYELGVKRIIPVDATELALASVRSSGQGEDRGSELAARALYMSDEYSPGGDQASRLPILPTLLPPYPPTLILTSLILIPSPVSHPNHSPLSHY